MKKHIALLSLSTLLILMSCGKDGGGGSNKSSSINAVTSGSGISLSTSPQYANNGGYGNPYPPIYGNTRSISIICNGPTISNYSRLNALQKLAYATTSKTVGNRTISAAVLRALGQQGLQIMQANLNAGPCPVGYVLATQNY